MIVAQASIDRCNRHLQMPIQATRRDQMMLPCFTSSEQAKQTTNASADSSSDAWDGAT
jgi:hypothetical protein